MSTRFARSLATSAALSAAIVIVAACGTGIPAGSGSAGGSAAPSVTPSGSGPSTSPEPSPSPSEQAGTLLLKVTSEGGFINPAASINALPIVEVYSDGRILTPGAQDAVAPPPLLPVVQVRSVGPEGAAAILAAIRTAGLDALLTGAPGVPGDSGADIFTVTIDGESVTNRLSGNGPGPGGPGVPGGGGSSDPGRAAVFELLARLVDPTDSWGGAATTATIYEPQGYRIFVIPGAPQSDPATAREPIAWPLATPLDAFGTPSVPDLGIAGLRQGVVLGADAATVGPLVARASSETAWTSGGKSWTLSVRPLLPDELGG